MDTTRKENSQPVKGNFLNSGNESRRLKLYILIAFLLLLWTAGAAVVSNFIISSSEKNFSEVSSVKLEKETKEINEIYYKYQSELLNSVKAISESKNFTKALSQSENKKVFDELLKFPFSENIQSEVYNKRLELVAFDGRQQNPTTLNLQKALSGNTFSIVKEAGFYSYLTIFSPLKDPTGNNAITGVLVSSRILDLKYSIQNKYFTSKGLTGELKNPDELNIEIIATDNTLNDQPLDSLKIKGNSLLELKGTDGKVIAKVLIPEYNRESYIESITELREKNFTLIIFIFSLLVLEAAFHYSKFIRSGFLRLSIIAFIFTGIRYLWIYSVFPNRFLSSELFSPSYYASSFGFGLSKSVGDLLITSIFILVIAVNYLKIITNSHSESRKLPLIVRSLILSGFLFVFFACIYAYGFIIQSIVFDSNLKFFDRTKIIPNVEVIFILLVVIVFSISLFLFLSGCILSVKKQLRLILNNFLRTKHKSQKKYLILILFAIFILLDLFLHPFLQALNLYQSGLIITLAFTFVYFIYSVNILKRKQLNFKFKELTFVLLLVIITVPYILFDKISVQETKYVELLGDKIAENVDDKINYLISSELAKFADNKNLEFSLKNNSKIQKLAFSLWADSKLSTEDLNSAVLILDTNKELISDFNINSIRLNSDSIISFYKSISAPKKKIMSHSDSLAIKPVNQEDNVIDEEPDFTGLDIMNIQSLDSIGQYKIDIYKNKSEKYYLGMIRLEDIRLRNTSFRRLLGYGLIAVQYEPKNFLVKSSLEIFHNYSRDNLMDKLLSSPVISEFVNDEMINTNDPSLSGVSPNSLQSFREYVKSSPVKRTWRFETINNEKYRSYFIEVPDPESGGLSDKIYTISLKRNDFNVLGFFYLKFILFCTFIYLVFSVIYLLLYLPQINIFKINFREKLFAAFFIVSVIPIIALALYTRSYINTKYDQTFANQIKSDLNLLSEGVKTKNFDLSLNKKIDTLSVQPKNILNKTFSQIDKNFNIFIKNKLVSTTNEELFQSGLIDERIDGSAFYNIFYEKKDLVLKNEDIGGYSFIVGYKPLLDRNNNLLGIISSQSVYRQNEVNEELTESLTFIFGIYVIAIILLLILVIFLTERISRPLSELKLATDRISKGESNVEIRNKGMDEFKGLVDSFNKMSSELERSKIQLQKAEREAAWRDIARRVAHEIKNPLTPMKLSIQHAFDVFKNEDGEKFAKIFDKTKDIMLKEIDKLNRIATEFSNFAKLPEKNYELLNINNILDDVISLYDTIPDIKFEIFKDPDIPFITGDKQELNRVFQNILKNSIQAIEENGLIKVKTFQTDVSVCIEFTDNGVGIDKDIMERLFEPDFSTKSTGMGLGLSIAKKSLDMMHADIHYKSEKDNGTIVVISFRKDFDGK
ncbi:hypothetical protein BH10BAC5_BH10BAC5_04560 [soil metagenome]